MENQTLETGAVVKDRSDATPDNRGVVVNIPNAIASEWDVKPIGKTVAQDNPDYSEDDAVAIVVFESTLKLTFPFFTGKFSIPIWLLKKRTGSFYSFPESRLEKVDEYGPMELPVDSIRPSPYAARDFDRDENAGIIDRLQSEGAFAPLLLNRVNYEFRVVNGHKRLWAAKQLGFETYPCHIHYFNEKGEAKYFLDAHFDPDEYTESERRETISALRDEFGEKAFQFERVQEYDPAIQALKDRFGGEVTDGVVTFNKLGDKYQVNREGEVVSGGPIADRVEQAAQEVV